MAKIGIDAKLVDGRSGGVQQFIIGLAQGLSKLKDTDNQYIFFMYSDQTNWLKPYVYGNCQIIETSAAPQSPKWRQRLRDMPYLKQLWHFLLSSRGKRSVPQSDGLIESLNIELMHFTTQRGFLTEIPTIYHPWDLQHLHLPHFFTSYERQQREANYEILCQQAFMVSAASSWIKNDLISHFNLPEDKIKVIPMASVLSDYPHPTDDDLAKMSSKLPSRFAYFPAQTWQHKNHLKLVEALAILRDEYGIIVPVVFSGTTNPYWQVIQKFIHKHHLQNQVTHVGYVSVVEVQALYQLCDMMVFPSRFEGWGLPLTEAMASGVPIACANSTHLPELVGDAGVIFDPDDAHNIADTIWNLWTDEEKRQELSQRGLERSLLFSWDYTARLFQAHYQRLLGQSLSEEDQHLLDAPALV